MNINDAINAAIADVAGFNNAIPDKLLRYYQANGATSLDRDDAEREFFAFLGVGEVLGTEVLPDPGFDSVPAWNVNGGWAVTGGKLVGTALGAGNFTTPQVNIPATDRFVFEMDMESCTFGDSHGVGFALDGVVVSPYYNTPGRHRFQVDATLGQTPGLIGSAAVGTDAVISRFSIRQSVGVHGGQNQMNDLWEYYLRTVKLYTGALDDMLYQYWTVGPRP